jgi:hypothetical protein
MALRLIHTSTLKLETFAGQRIPEYAILSHTWVVGHEISYQDIVSINTNASHPASRKSGYSKILKTCEVARDIGLEYVWADTCCIDKSSSAELSEAINSMFQWYHAAKVCLVYLSDLRPTSRLEYRMPRCKWFTRGWCLQELIAPRDVRFYNCYWDFIGRKLDTNLMGLISRISKIDEAVLADTSLLPTLSVAQKMSWAANRETTKPEDIAYCLLGIFDVHMPLLYGEGSKAFMRLQEEIIKRSNDLSIFAWGHPMTTRPPSEAGSLHHSVDEEENDNNVSAGQTACCDLFAESPSDFSNCGGLILQTAAAQRNFAFSLTNNGLFLSRVRLRVDFENSCYVIPLLCYEKGSPLDGTYLALGKIGPDLFVRLKRCNWENLFRWNQRIDGYVVTKISNETRTFVENCHIESVQIRSPLCSKQALHAAILEVSPQETWDPSSLVFLRDDDRHFSGHVKLDGRILRGALSGSLRGWDDIYLTWGGGLKLTGSLEPDSVCEAVWVRLCWAKDWVGDNNQSALREQMFLNDPNSLTFERDNIRRGSEIIEAEVAQMGDFGSQYFRINISLR